MIHMDPKALRELHRVLSPYPYHFYAFGSRVRGTHRKFSDLDIFYKESIPPKVFFEIEEGLEESRLPFKVDLVAWDKLPPEFQEDIAPHWEKIQ